MKKIIGILALVFVFSLTANAQKQRQGKKEGMQPKLTTEQAATLHTKKLQLHLDLNASQQVQIFNLFKEQAAERETQRTEMQKRRTAGERPTDAERFEFQKLRLDKQIAHKAEMKKILNNDQYEKWEKFQALKMRSGKKGMKGSNKEGKKGSKGNKKNKN